MTPVKSLEFDTGAFEDVAWRFEQDRKVALRILKLIREIQRTPYEGTGQPERLKTRTRRLLVTPN